MKNPLRTLLDEAQELERSISERIQRNRAESRAFEVESGKPVFGQEARLQYKPHKKSIWVFLRESSFLKILTAPVVYSIVIPLTLLDLFVVLFQSICFPLYGIPKVQRRDYIVLDRHLLPYLNFVEKINCVYCGYANGVIAFAREVAARSEQHWCPIKHARQAKGCHLRHCLFSEYGDAAAFRRQCEQVRADFSDVEVELD